MRGTHAGEKFIKILVLKGSDAVIIKLFPNTKILVKVFINFSYFLLFVSQ